MEREGKGTERAINNSARGSAVKHSHLPLYRKPKAYPFPTVKLVLVILNFDPQMTSDVYF